MSWDIGDRMSRRAGGEVNISFGDKLFILDSELGQKLFCDFPSVAFSLLATKHNFEFQKISQAFYGIDVDPRLAYQKQNSRLFHFTDSAQRSRKNIEQNFWSRSVRNLISRAAGFRQILALILNQFAAIGLEESQFQSPCCAAEEEIVL